MFSELLKRASLSHIGEFIKSGMEIIEERETKSYNDSIRETEHKICELIDSKFEKCERQEIHDIIYEQIGVREDIYFELGLFAGVKIAHQIIERTREIQ